MSTPTNPPSEAELTQFVVDKLAAFGNREDLTLDVCHLMGWEWDRAELFIKAVQETQFRRIAFGQSPWLIVISIGLLVFGLILVVGNGWVVWSAYRSELLTDPSFLVRTPRLLWIFIVGISFIVGALGGMWVFTSQVIRGR